jgi:hypothetical protein
MSLCAESFITCRDNGCPEHAHVRVLRDTETALTRIGVHRTTQPREGFGSFGAELGREYERQREQVRAYERRLEEGYLPPRTRTVRAHLAWLRELVEAVRDWWKERP